MRRRQRAQSDAGIALLLVVISLALFLAVAATLVLMASMEIRMAGAERARHAVRGAAEVALERALQEMAIAADLNEILAGSVRSGVAGADLAPDVAGWGALDLPALTAGLQRASDASNQWGADGQVWRRFGYASLDTLLDAAGSGASGASSAGGAAGAPEGGGAAGSAFYTVAWVSDDPADGDGNPSADGNGRVVVRAEAFGPFRSRQALVATVRRQGGSLEVISWREPAG
jgi:Tfp pilus assembly protein PilX